MVYRPDQFAKHYSATRQVIRNEIENADYLSFSIGGLFGDWGSVACYQAFCMNRPYAVWTDRVESEVVRRTSNSGSWRNRVRARLTHRPMAQLERYLIRRAELGLFHGKETFDTYAPYCSNPHIVHDIHIKKDDHIKPSLVDEKVASTETGPLKIIYVGRADAMKGGLDWVEVLSRLAQEGVQFQATWIGDGDDLLQMEKKAVEYGLDDRVSFPGFLSNRSDVLGELQKADVFMFCPKTPESPRCLIEALISGTPIIGYDGAFARDLISKNGGGRLVELNDVDGLSNVTCDLHRNRNELAALIRNAASDGADFDDEHVFEHRSELIRRYL